MVVMRAKSYFGAPFADPYDHMKTPVASLLTGFGDKILREC
jgi:hypothetical protein